MALEVAKPMNGFRPCQRYRKVYFQIGQRRLVSARRVQQTQLLPTCTHRGLYPINARMRERVENPHITRRKVYFVDFEDRCIRRFFVFTRFNYAYQRFNQSDKQFIRS